MKKRGTFTVDTAQGRMSLLFQVEGNVARVSKLLLDEPTGETKQVDRVRYAGSGIPLLVVDGKWDMTQVQLLAQKYCYTIRKLERLNARSR